MQFFIIYFHQSGSERTSRSRLGSSSSATSEQSPVNDGGENGDTIDYKALYEAARYAFFHELNFCIHCIYIYLFDHFYRSDNDRLKLQMKKKDEDLMNARSAIERFTNAVSVTIAIALFVDLCLFFPMNDPF